MIPVLCVATAATAAAATAASSSPRPLLAPAPNLSVDQDLPAAVKARIDRVTKDLRDGARRCNASPPRPKIAARVLGHHVEVAYDIARLPKPCPVELSVVVYSGRKATSTFNNYVQRYWLDAEHGRVTLDLPWGGRPPYHVIAETATPAGMRARVERSLRCPSPGCLAGYRPSLHSYPLPKPVLRVRGVDRRGLETSFDYALAGERRLPPVNAVPRSVRCASRASCTVTYVDPDFGSSPYRVRYRVAGQQVPGCWMAMRGAVLDERPFEDAFTGQLELAACVTWSR